MSKVGELGPVARSILDQALTLPISDRVDLIERIVRSIDKADPSLDPEWLKRAEDRLAAYRSRDIPAVDTEQVFDVLDKRT